jgi:TonB family protein
MSAALRLIRTIRTLLLAGVCLAAAGQRLGAQAVLRGSITDTSGAPIAGVLVAVDGTSAQARTDDRGTFLVSNVPMGTQSVTARRLGFAPFQVALQVSQDSGAEIAIRMTPIVETLPPVVVRPERMSYSGRLAGYYQRLEKRSSGYFITREQIDHENPSTMGQLLAKAPGIQAFRGRHGITAVRMRGRNCWPLVWLDGIPMPAGEVDLDGFVPSSIQGIELYLGSTTAPIRYIYDGDRSSCGTILIWSRGPDTDPIHKASWGSADLEELVSQNAAYTADNVDRQASLDLRHPLAPTFPPSLFASRTPGLVITEFVVDTLGRVEDGTVGIVSSTAPPFAAAARDALATATFSPALKGGRPVRQIVQQSFKFDVDPPPAQR